MQMNNLTITNAILNNAYLDYVDKCSEVTNFFNLVAFLENTKDISAKGLNKVSSEEKSIVIDRPLIETIQSSSFLLLYNLIESTMTAAIDAIYQNLQHLEQQHQNTPNLFIFNLTKNLRKSLIKQYAGIFSIDGINDFTENIRSFFSSVINSGYDKKNLFNGNIDCSQIDDITRKKFGFKVLPFDGQLYDSQHILSIKNKRNNLAHGSQTFTEVSRYLAMGELKEHLESVINLLNGVFSSIENYLTNQKYLEPA